MFRCDVFHLPVLEHGHLAHLDVTVSDPEASKPFYEAVLSRIGFSGGEPGQDHAGGWTHSSPRGGGDGSTGAGSPVSSSGSPTSDATSNAVSSRTSRSD